MCEKTDSGHIIRASSDPSSDGNALEIMAVVTVSCFPTRRLLLGLSVSELFHLSASRWCTRVPAAPVCEKSPID